MYLLNLESLDREPSHVARTRLTPPPAAFVIPLRNEQFITLGYSQLDRVVSHKCYGSRTVWRQVPFRNPSLAVTRCDENERWPFGAALANFNLIPRSEYQRRSGGDAMATNGANSHPATLVMS